MLFNNFYRIKPPSSRKESAEIFYIGKGYQKGIFYREIAQCDPKNMNFEVFVQKYLDKVKTKNDTGFSSGLAIRDTIKSMYSILQNSEITRKTPKISNVQNILTTLLVFENDKELFNAILYNPVAENIHYSTKNTKSGTDGEEDPESAVQFEQFLEDHKNEYTFAQQNTLDSLLTSMKESESNKKKEDSIKRVNQDDFEILDIDHDLEFGRKDLSMG